MSKELSWDEFEQQLVKAGYSDEEAHKMRLDNEFGDEGDPDGELDSWW